MYHIRGWGKFNRHYGDFCTGADNRRITLNIRKLAGRKVSVLARKRFTAIGHDLTSECTRKAQTWRFTLVYFIRTASTLASRVVEHFLG